MIESIVTEFRSTTQFSLSNEVDLFRNLARAIVKHSKSTFIDETHGGNVCNVTFASINGKTETCEIADLLIVSCGRNGCIRATFWQAKKESQSKWVSATGGDEQLDFAGQFDQWYLLSRRPSVKGVMAFLPPSDLLSSSASASIGSFGVFYQIGSDVELSHSVAECIACSNPNAKKPRLSINGYLSHYSYASGEVLTRTTLTSFLKALFALQVGAILDPTNASHRWLVERVRSKSFAREEGKVDLSDFNRFLGSDPPIIDIHEPLEDGLSVLVVRPADEE